MDFSNKQRIYTCLKTLKHFYVLFLNKKYFIYYLIFISNFRIFFFFKTILQSKIIGDNLHYIICKYTIYNMYTYNSRYNLFTNTQYLLCENWVIIMEINWTDSKLKYKNPEKHITEIFIYSYERHLTTISNRFWNEKIWMNFKSTTNKEWSCYKLFWKIKK